MVPILVALLLTLSGCFLIIEASSENETFTMGCSTDDKQFAPNTRAHDTNTIFDWPHGKIPYRFEGTVTYNDRQVIRSAMNQIEAQTCIRYNQVQSPPGHYLRILVKSASCSCGIRCSSFSGVVNTLPSSQVVTLTSFRQLADFPHCSSHTEGGIVHELMHALGVQHTQKRSDRDSYIRVNVGNILQNYISQYSPPCYACKNHGVPYDCSSIMHYGTQTFSNGRGPTMTPKVAGCNIGQQGRSVATKNDWDMLRQVAKNQCSSECQPAADTWNGDCSAYTWACTSSRYPWYKEVCSTTCDYCVSSGQCRPAANTWNGDCSAYTWACTDSRYPWYKTVCSTTCKYCP